MLEILLFLFFIFVAVCYFSSLGATEKYSGILSAEDGPGGDHALTRAKKSKKTVSFNNIRKERLYNVETGSIIGDNISPT